MSSKRDNRQTACVEGHLQRPAPRAIDALIEAMEELKVLDDADEAMELAEWCKSSGDSDADSPPSAHCSNRSLGRSNCIQHLETGVVYIRALPLLPDMPVRWTWRPGTGTIVKCNGPVGHVRGQCGALYSFLPLNVLDQSLSEQLLGLPVFFEPEMQKGQIWAQNLTIDWRTVLLRSLMWTWRGSPLPPGLTLTLDGRILQWNARENAGLVSVSSRGTDLKATIRVQSVAMDDVDRDVCSGGFPVTVDVCRCKGESNYRATSLRIRWRPVLEQYAIKEQMHSPFRSILKPPPPRRVGGPGFRALKTLRRLPPRPCAATLIKFDGRTGIGTLKSIHDCSLVQFALDELRKEDCTDLTLGMRLFYWTPPDRVNNAVAILGRARTDSEKWPLLRVCIP